jgi:hypothetical protein
MNPSAAGAKTPSVWEDLLEIFYAPTAVFERRRETPAFGLALILFVVLSVALTFAFRGLMEPVFDAEFKRGMAQAMKQNPNMTPEMAETAKQFAKKFLVVIVAFYALLTPLLLGVILWLVGKFLDSKAEIGQTMMVATYAMYPRVLEAVLGAAQALILPEESLKSRFSLSLGVGRFLDPDTTGALLLQLLGRLDLFTLWVTVLMAIGLSVVGRIPKPRAAIAGVLMWLIGALPGVLGALRGS